MIKLLNTILLVSVVAIFTSCGGGGGGSTTLPPSTQTDLVDINGVAVDNYIKDATVCVDENKNDICDATEPTTTTDINGSFSFDDLNISDSDIVIAYGGTDIETGEPFPYILKNIYGNQDSSGEVVLSSLNTLVAVYVNEANTTISEAKTAITKFLGAGIESDNIDEDVIANMSTQEDEFLRSLKIFQMVAKINDVNDSTNSAKSFKAIVEAIIDSNDTIEHNSSTISVTVDGVVKDAAVLNSKPIVLNIPIPTVTSGSTYVTDLDFVVDPDDDNLTYSIVSSSDGNLFETYESGTKLKFKQQPIYNLDEDNNYTITLSIDDNHSNIIEQNITISVIVNTNDEYTPEILLEESNISVNENTINVIDIDALDYDGTLLVYSISGTDSASFDINSSTGVIKFKVAPDYETKQTYSIVVAVSDEDETVEENLTININNLNDNNPHFTGTYTVSVNENQTSAITLSATDADNDDLTYSISGTDATSFDVNDTTGIVTFKIAPDYEVKGSYTFTATVEDTDGNSASQSVVINIGNLNDNNPVFTNSTTVNANENQSDAITLSATDADNDDLIYSIVGGTDESSFNINSTTGAVTFVSLPNYEIKTSYTFIANVDDGENDVNQTITINIINLNDNNPVFTNSSSVSVNENQTSAITLSATDADNNDLTYSISGGDATSFSINDLTGVVTFNSAPDYEVKSSYTFIATVDDGADQINQTVTININNLNDNNPVITTTSTNVYENQTSAITLSATDADGDDINYSISGGDSASFTIDSSTGVVIFNSAPNYEEQTSYTFSATASDGLNSDTETITITILDVSEVGSGPAFTGTYTVSVNENQTSAITLSATDADNDDLTYSISGTDATSFDVNDTTGIVTFKIAPDYEVKGSYTFTATVEDTDGNSASQSVVINIGNLNDNNPVFTNSTTVNANENQSDAITLSATDADNDDLIYSIVGGTDESSFNINSTTGAVTFVSLPNYEIKTSYTFIANVDDGENDVNQTITINIINLNDNNPVFTNSSSVSVNENQTSAITLSATDADNNDLTYSISGGDATSFSINDLTGVVTFNSAPDYEVKSSYTFIATVDDTSNELNQTVTININNLNDNNPVITTTSASVEENQVNAITLSATDADGDDINYSISGGDSASFTTDSATGVVTFNSSPDYEIKNSYTFNATATDGTNSDTKLVTISIEDVFEVGTPTDMNLTNNSINENNEVNVTIGVLNTTDPDEGETFTYTLVSGDGDTDNESFNIVGSNLRISIVANYEEQSSYSIRVRTTDSDNAVFEKEFNITINDVNDVAYFTTTPTLTILQNQTYEYVANIVDVDAGATLTESAHTIPSGFSTLSSGNGTSEVNITVSGTTDDSHVGTNNIVLNVIEDNTSGTISQDFNLTVTDVNDAPTYEGNTSLKIINLGESDSFSFDIADGDSQASQTITITTESNDTSVATVAAVDPIEDENTSNIVVTTVNSGEANITVTLTDDGGLENGGENNTTFSFIVKVRPSGWKIYQEQKDSNFTISSVNFDDIVYDWNTTSKWYEFNNTILMPIQILEEEYHAGDNLIREDAGHYYVFTSNYLSAQRVAEGNDHDPDTDTYTTASGGTTTANNDNFQHDPHHNFFVSSIVQQENGENNYDKKSDTYAYWTGQATPSFVAADDTNRSFASAESFSTYFIDSSDDSSASHNSYLDENNDGNSSYNICASIYGEGWRLPTIYEIGVENDDSTDIGGFGEEKGFIPAYVGDELANIWTSTRYANDNDQLILLRQTNGRVYHFENTESYEARCIY
jgi:hypothetical protein